MVFTRRRHERKASKFTVLRLIALSDLRETGVNAVEDGAFTLGHAFDIFRMARARGLDVNEFPKKASFFLSASIDFFEEIAKFRAMRRLYART